MRFQNRIGRACFHLELQFVTLLLLLALVGRSEEGSLFGNEGAPLYGPEDKVFMLNATTIKDHIYGSSRGWVVEFFSSWCGHCISFAPKWKQFALDLAPWQNTLVIAGLDCADEKNVAICREYEIMGYPTIRFFPPHVGMHRKIMKDGESKDDLYRGEEIDKSENLGDMKRNILDLIAPHLSNFFDKATGIADFSSLWSLARNKASPPNDVPSTALVIFEKDDGYVGNEVAASLSKFPSLVIFRFAKKNALYDQLRLDGWPAVGYIKKDHSSGKIILKANHNLVDHIIQEVAVVAGIPLQLVTSTANIQEALKSEVKVVKDEVMPNIIEEPGTSGSVVSMEDLVHAARNALRNEVGLFKEITGSQLQSLKNFVHVLAEFFPADRRELIIFLAKLSHWLGPLEKIDDTTYMDKLTELEVELHPWDIDVNTWGNCKGSLPGRRGYTCSLWSLFHTLTVVAHEKKQDFPVLDAIHGFVKHFFGCKECSNHFTQMVADDGALMLSLIKDQVLWLWKAHNKVNLRIKGSLSEDPMFPKIPYPSETQCPECRDGNAFKEDKVLQWLLKTYSKPERTQLPVKDIPDRVYSSRVKFGESKSFFSGFDYWLFCIVYLSVAVLLIWGFLHFRTRRGRFDISYLFCRKVKLYTGKNNV